MLSENRFCYCPHCHTVFRLPAENPDRSSSLFRCCVCREMFDSSDNTILETDPGFVHGFAQAGGPEAEKIPEKSLVQPVLEEKPLAWVSENTAHQYMNDRRKPLIKLAWCIVSVVLFLLLSLQVKYFHVDKFAQDQSLRKYLAGFCKIARCELPPLKSPDLFTVANTKIDLHPRQPDALRVTVKLINRAEYSQPFPDLQITLTDEAGRVIGRRSFPPQSYLATGSESMVGHGELVSLSFDLARPHEKAVGFSVHVVTD